MLEFLAPHGGGDAGRALPPGAAGKKYHSYEVLKPIDAWSGKAKRWFYEPGGGIQYQVEKSIKDLVNGGYLRRIIGEE